VLHAYDANGNRLSWNAFRTLQENGKESNGDNDVLLDPATLRVLSTWGLPRRCSDKRFDAELACRRRQTATCEVIA